MANTIDADDPLVSWTVQQGNQPNASTLSGNKLARWQYQHAPGNVILSSALPSKTVQTAAGLPYEQLDRFLYVANDATTQANVRSGATAPDAYAFPAWATTNAY